MRHLRVILPFLVAAPAFLLQGGCCKQKVGFEIAIGHKTQAECARLLEAGQGPAQSTGGVPTSIICPGEEVTLCWASNVNQVDFSDPAVGAQPGSGATYLKPQATESITATASDCAKATREVLVINGPTPFTFDAGWDCSKIWFDVDPMFVSQKVMALDITANWTPTVQDGNGNTVICQTPPFLAGFQTPENFGFTIMSPFLTTPFSRHLHAVGHWQFVFKATCPVPAAEEVRTCNQYATFPFDLTLTCQ